MIVNTIYKKSGGIELSSIAVKTPPTVTEYKADETIDVSGMVLEATYSNGATREVTTGFTYSPTVAATGDTAITISFTEFGVTATTTQAISVVLIKAVFSENSWPDIIAAVHMERRRQLQHDDQQQDLRNRHYRQESRRLCRRLGQGPADVPDAHDLRDAV